MAQQNHQTMSSCLGWWKVTYRGERIWNKLGKSYYVHYEKKKHAGKQRKRWWSWRLKKWVTMNFLVNQKVVIVEGAKIYKTSYWRCMMSIWCLTNGFEQSWNFANFVFWIGLQMQTWIKRVEDEKSQLSKKLIGSFQHKGSKNKCFGSVIQL
jgi:hypothetical protein